MNPYRLADRQFVVTVENGLGDQADVEIAVPQDVNPGQRAGVAIFKARRILPDVKPWRIVCMNEV